MENNSIKNQINKITQIKKNQIKIQKLFSFDEKLFNRICTCGHNIVIEKRQHIITLETKTKVTQARTCHIRFCNLCNYYRVRNLTPQIVNELSKLVADDKELIFFTPTVPNCDYLDLRETIQRMNKSFAKMITNNAFKNNVHAWIRTLEITFKRQDGKAHPHFHCIFAINKSYFKNKNYMRPQDWSKLWSRCYKSDSTLVTKIQRVKSKNENQLNPIHSAVAELSKYVTKSADLKNLDVADMQIIHGQLARLRFIVTSRNIKLDETKEPEIDEELWRLIEYIFFGWQRKSEEYRHKKTVSR